MNREDFTNEREATVIETGQILMVYRLKNGTPTPEHIWADATPYKLESAKPFGEKTFKESELKFKK